MVRVAPFKVRVVCGALLLGFACLPVSVWAAPDAPPKTLSVPDAVAEVLPSVVSVMAHGPVRATPTQAVPSGSGSGVVISPGYILTSNHLVAGATRLVIGLYDGRLVPGRVVGRDFLTDLAIIRKLKEVAAQINALVAKFEKGPRK